jgi:hypothetical protein
MDYQLAQYQNESAQALFYQKFDPKQIEVSSIPIWKNLVTQKRRQTYVNIDVCGARKCRRRDTLAPEFKQQAERRVAMHQTTINQQ